MKSSHLLILLGLSVLFASVLSGPVPESDEDDDWWDEDPAPAEEDQDEMLPIAGRSVDHDNHANHMEGEKASVLSPDERAGLSGSNLMGYNQSCLQYQCNHFNNLKCDTAAGAEKKCVCLDKYTYIRSQEKCYPILRGDSGDQCEFDGQCHNGPFGALSRCSKMSGKCECYDPEGRGRDIVKTAGNVCVVKRRINETCERDAECEASMKHNARCGSDPMNPVRTICQCGASYQWEDNLEECLKVAVNGPGSECKTDMQCQKGQMGDLSKCINKQCRCNDPKNPGEDNVRFYSGTGTCYERKVWNSTCSVDEECKASISPDAECLAQEPEDGYAGGVLPLVCKCPDGKTCKSKGFLGVREGSVGGTVGLTLVAVVWFRLCKL